jgi:hypothetical protein
MKRRFKKLKLHRETLSRLEATQLRAVNGGTVYYLSEFETQCPGLCDGGSAPCTGGFDNGCNTYGVNCTVYC